MKPLLIVLLCCICLFSCTKDDGPKTCPDGYYGNDCDQQLAPIITVKSITITYPATDNGGAGWDLTSGPDVYISLSSNGTEIFNNEANFIQNATGTLTIPVNVILLDVNSLVNVSVIDYDDFDPDDFMGGIEGKIYTNTNGFPPNVTLSCSGCAVSAKLALDYAF